MLREEVKRTAKEFKAGWVGLGRVLHEVQKNRLFREWGYDTFEAYVKNEIGIKKTTALKLLRSYYFLEKEEPDYLNADYRKETSATKVPEYEAIDVLRRVKEKEDIDKGDYSKIRKSVFNDGVSATDVRKEITALMKQREERDPEEVHEKKRLSTLRRFISILKSLKQEIALNKSLPREVIQKIESLIDQLEVVI